MVQHRDEATARAGRQFSKSVDSGASVWRGLEDSKRIPLCGENPPAVTRQRSCACAVQQLVHAYREIGSSRLSSSLGTRLSLRGRRVWPTAHTRLVLASHNYSGKLSGCRPQCFHWGHCANRERIGYARNKASRNIAVCTCAPSENIAGTPT